MTMTRWLVITLLLIAVVLLAVSAAVTRRRPVPITNPPVRVVPKPAVDKPSPTPAPQPAAVPVSPTAAPQSAESVRPAVVPPAPVPTPPAEPLPDLPLKYQPAGTVGDGPVFARALTGLAMERYRPVLYACGDDEVKAFDAEGKLLRTIRCAKPPLCVAADGQGGLVVGQDGQIERFDAAGKAVATIPIQGAVTAVGVLGGEILVGNATARKIVRLGVAGKLLGEIPASGAVDLTPDDPKTRLILPNRILSFAVDRAGRIVVANPGRHQVQTFDLAGKLLEKWGRYSEQAPEAFCGCCNPINLAVFALGGAASRYTMTGNGIVTAEKAIARVKVFDAAGGLLGIIGPEFFDQANTSMPLAVDPAGRIYVADTTPRIIRRFALAPAPRAPQPAAAPVVQKTGRSIRLGINDVFCEDTRSACVGDQHRRRYGGLLKALADQTGLDIHVTYFNTEALLVDAVKAGKLDAVVCKTWAAMRAAEQAKLELFRLADLTMPDGATKLTGVFFTRVDSPLRSIADVEGKTLGVGQADSYEKSIAVDRRLAHLNVQPVRKSIPTCLAAAAAVHDKEVDAAVLSSYAFYFGTLDVVGKREDYRLLGQTEDTPFLSFAAFGTVSPTDRDGLARVLLKFAYVPAPQMGATRIMPPQPWPAAGENSAAGKLTP